MFRLVFVRHGESLWNVEQRIQGNQDPGLSPRGQAQTELLILRLKGQPFVAVYSSPLKRAEESAAILASALGLPLHFLSDLREMGLGDWEGKTVEEIEAEYGNLYREWLACPLEAQPPHGESLLAFQSRVVRAIEAIKLSYPGQDLLVVTHAGVIKAYVGFVLGFDSNRIFRLKIDNTAVNEVLFEGSSTRLSLLNDICHLAGLREFDEPVHPAF